MKKLYLVVTLFVFSYSFSQEYYSFNDTIYNKSDFNLLLKRKEKQKKLKAYFIPNKSNISNDSIIKYGTLAMFPKDFEIDKIYDNLLKPLPYFYLEKQKGGFLNSDSLKGKLTIINLWFTNCPPCVEEIPILNNLKEKYGESINTIAITFEDREKVMQFNQLHKFDFEIVINAKKYINSLGVNGYPKIIVLDKYNIVRYIPFGIIARDVESSEFLLQEFTKKIDELLKE